MTCCNCSATTNLYPHYIVPLEKGGRDIPTNRVHLCRDCRALLFPSISRYIKSGLKVSDRPNGRPRVREDKIGEALMLYAETNTPVHEIIERTGVSQGTLYRHLRANKMRRQVPTR